MCIKNRIDSNRSESKFCTKEGLPVLFYNVKFLNWPESHRGYNES